MNAIAGRWFRVVILGLVLSGFLSCKDKKTSLFESLPASFTKISFSNTLPAREHLNILYYLYYYNGGGVATGDINKDGLVDIYFTANSRGGNKLFLNKGDFLFEDITEKAGVAGTADWSSGVTMADVNGDGYLDVYVVASSRHHGLTGRNQLYINNGNNRFSDSAAAYGLDFSGFGTQAAFFDYDRDGDLDCYLLNHSQKPNANIRDTVNRHQPDSLSGDRFYRNDLSRNGRFTDVSAAAGIYQSSLGYGLGIAVADFNQDGWDDIYVGNDFHENDYYYLNNGNGTFRESGADHFGHYSRFSMGNDAADFNNDGQTDIITVDMLPPDEKVLKTYGSDENPDTYKFKLMGHGYQHQFSKNCLQRNNGRGQSFSETGLQSGIAATDWSWSPLFADFDNDGNKDLFISSGIVKRPVDLDYIRFVSDLVLKNDVGNSTRYDQMAIEKMPDGASHPYFFRGDGQLGFTDQSDAWGMGSLKGYYNGASYADLDNDGNLDVVVNCLEGPALVLKNKLPAKYTVDLAFIGNTANTYGIGAKAWLFSAGKMQYQQLMTTRGFQSSVDPKLHFGTDSLKYIDSILVVWPDQKFQLLKNVPAKGLIQVKQAEAGGVFDYGLFFPPATPLFTDITRETGLSWKHRENDFLDYNKQYLIPHQLSTRGPKLAVADVNRDGLDDFYVCGAAGQSGQLMLQTAGGMFVADSIPFTAYRASEETDALFLDANQDGYPDLLVISGGNESPDGDSLLADHLYLNNGKGRLIVQPGAIPALLKNKSCAAAADVDKDGDTDLFLGVLAEATQYGRPQLSYLLLNDGKGSYNLAPSTQWPAEPSGMVTSAAFADINNDGWPDLVQAGEWMPVLVYLNQSGGFKAAPLTASTGLWQSLFITDVNKDGFLDILAGNWGHNNKFTAGKNGPLKLYVKDFDKNGSTEQVLAYTVNGNEYSFLAKDELERSLPVLKKAYLNYSDVAGKTVQYMFYDLFRDYQELKAEVLASSCFLNDGKGNFSRTDLPAELQLAPLMAFADGGKGQSYIAAGNFYGVIPYEGRYDAMLPTLFYWDAAVKKMKGSAPVSSKNAEWRDIKWLRSGGGSSFLLLSANNEKIQVLKK